MTQIFKEDGTVVPVTAVLAETNVVTQVKTKEKDGYESVQIGFGHPKNLKKPQIGHQKGIAEVKTMREFRVAAKDMGDIKRGDKVTVATFVAGDGVQVIGFSKGKGFQGVVKRHGFHGSMATHGHKDQLRMPGSIGSTGPQRVFKGQRMAGHMGNEQITVTGLEIVAVDEAKNILYVKGAVPGARGGMLLISGKGEIQFVREETKPVIEKTVVETKEEVKEEIVTENIVPTEEVKAEEPKVEEAKTEEVVESNQ